MVLANWAARRADPVKSRTVRPRSMTRLVTISGPVPLGSVDAARRH